MIVSLVLGGLIKTLKNVSDKNKISSEDVNIPADHISNRNTSA
jgi:hypothetical protein